MIGLEAAATAAGKAVAQRAGREWLAARSAKADRNKDLAELIQYGHPGARLVLQSDKNLVIYARDGHPLWATGTDNWKPPKLPTF